MREIILTNGKGFEKTIYCMYVVNYAGVRFLYSSKDRAVFGRYHIFTGMKSLAYLADYISSSAPSFEDWAYRDCERFDYFDEVIENVSIRGNYSLFMTQYFENPYDVDAAIERDILMLFRGGI